jgi:hypothetical protein
MHRRIRTLALAAALGTTILAADEAAADGEVNVLVLRENSAGSAATAQPYIDSLMVHVARANGWSGAAGAYHTKRSTAKTYVETAKPQYGILSLGAFLALRGELNLQVVGQADVDGGGGLQYFVVSKTQKDLAGCKGKTLATNHGGDTHFVDKVVGKGSFALADFTVQTTTRPVQTLKKVISGEAVCALIDDAQIAELAKLDGGADVKPVWLGAILPPMPIVAFGSAPAAGVTTFKSALPKVCEGEGAAACKSAGIKALRASDKTPYDAVIAAWSAK